MNRCFEIINEKSEVQKLSEAVAEFGRLNNLSQRAVYTANLVLEELAVNIIAYAYDDRNKHIIQVGLDLQDRKLTVTLEDDGREFNPTAPPLRPEHNITLDDIEDLELGLRLVRMLVDGISYTRKDGRNILTLVIEDVPGKKTIASMLREERLFPPSVEFSAAARIGSLDEYRRLYRQSVADPEAFWGKQAEELEWFRKWDRVLAANFEEAEHTWFAGGALNVAWNCLDRHLKNWRKNKAAIIWEGDQPGEQKILTYQQLHRQVCRFANVLKKHGVKKGDRVTLYLPMIVELPVAMLACARIGAIHSVVFGGFSADSLKDRMLDCDSRLLICADGYRRGGRPMKSKEHADQALASCPNIQDVIVVRRTGLEVPMQPERDFWWDEEMAAPDIDDYCEPEVMDAEDPLFILYTSGSTGKPKGVLHSTAGYLLYAAQTFKWVFDVREEDTWWCTADIGWITGHSYIVYGPLANGATSVMFEGVPNFPKPDRFWDVIEKYRVSLFYTAPTALRALMREGDRWIQGRDLSSLRLLGSVGEPINPEVWIWYHEKVGGGRCPIVDTWWQTETGGIVISPLPGATPCKPGSATLPLFGIEPEVIRNNPDTGDEGEGGWLVIRKPWPGLMRRVYGDPERFKKTYFSRFPGVYTTGDGAMVDGDGYYWIMGRIDDVINVSGHRLGTAELESALVSHDSVAEAAAVGIPHETKGQGIYAFVTLKAGEEKSDRLISQLKDHVRKMIGPIATPDTIQLADDLPKTRSGKIVRRILTKIAAGDVTHFGDMSTLTDTSVIADLIEKRMEASAG